MKRTIMTSLALAAFVSMTTVYAAAPVTAATAVVAQEKTPVKQADLPEAVKTALAGDDFKGHTFSEAFLVKSTAGEYYEIKLKNGTEETTVKLDKDGKKVD
jgi:uncharacterized cupredoxin-like copper-binding protein